MKSLKEWMLKISRNEFVYTVLAWLGAAIFIACGWRAAEILIHGSSQESYVDAIIAILLAAVWVRKLRDA